MKILIIGGTGHIGTFLVPRLIVAGHEVSVVARHTRPQYGDARLAWGSVRWIVADRRKEEQDNTWRRRMDQCEADAVIDLICFTPAQNRLMLDAFAGRVRHFLHCGTIWAYGPVTRAPCDETCLRRPICDYGRDKAQIEADLLDAFQLRGFPATVIHPGHISSREWIPADPSGTFNGVEIYRKLARGETVVLPNDGLATLQHVHADDVAQLFQLALERRQAALGESFSAVGPYAMTLRECCRCVAALFGKEPKLEYRPLAAMRELLEPEVFGNMAAHVEHSPCVSIAKAQRLLGYTPRYTTERIYQDCVEHWLATGKLVV